MTLPLRWSPDARRELGIVLAFIRERSPQAAERLRAQIEHATELVSSHPYIHRPGRVEGTREAVVHPNYLFVYVVRDDHIRILRVLHARQQYP